MVIIKSPEEIKKIAVAGKILAKILKTLAKEAKIGVSLDYLDKLAYQLTIKEKAKPAFLGYQASGAEKPFGGSICASVNNVIVHGLPSTYKLKSGDILGIDFGVEYDNFFADAALTVGIGNISKEAKRLIKATKLALKKAINQLRPDKTLGDIGWVIQKTAKDAGFKIPEGLTGHGVGKMIHEDPSVYNYGEKGKGMKLKQGMVLAIEPMFAIGTDEIIQIPDDSWATADGSLSAHFEHTIAITSKGPKVLTD
ncbi:type I methionyl aminopeptidase [Candidatus Wolfebacteria bacterium]|nr:type I methionyl aminopeptidase [Candidatus Wolfebacteria bacterium]